MMQKEGKKKFVRDNIANCMIVVLNILHKKGNSYQNSIFKLLNDAICSNLIIVLSLAQRFRSDELLPPK